MLFGKKIDPRCAYCKKGVALDEDLILCIRKGFVSFDGHCAFFRYDPLKRTPPRLATPDFSKLKDEDFVL